MKTRISYDELRHRCKIAIKAGWSRNQLFKQLKQEKRMISRVRLEQMWARLGGPVQFQMKW